MVAGKEKMDRFRRNLLLTGLTGLLLAALLGSAATWLVVNGHLTPPLSFPPVVWLLAAVLGGFSLAEIPLMVFVMRRLVVERESNRAAVLGLNALYVFFAAVYGVPLILLTGSLAWGLALCALSLVRLATSMIFVRRSRSRIA